MPDEKLVLVPGVLAPRRQSYIEPVSSAFAHQLPHREPADVGADLMGSVSPRAIMRPRRGLDPITGPLLSSLVIQGLLYTSLPSFGVATFNAVATALTNIIGASLLIGGSLLLSSGQSQRPQVRDPQSQKQSYDLEDGPRIIVLGKARVGGVFALRASTGFDTYRLLAQCQGRVDGFEEYYVKDRDVTVDFDGAVSSPPYARAGVNYLYIFSQPGTSDQVAYSQLTSAFPSDWTSNHRLKGIATTLAKYTSPGVNDSDFLKVWPEGYPQIDCLIRGQRLYDPRLDSTTASGSGSQRTNDDTTWTWTDNGVLGVLWFCTATEENGGFGLSFDKFDLDDIALEAAKADVAVDSKAGVGAEVRSKISGSYTTDVPRSDILAEMLLSTGCQIVRLQNGKMSIRLDEDNAAATVNVARENIIDCVYGGDEIVTDANQLNLFFLSPNRGWKLAEIQIQDKSWARDADSITATGKRTETLKLKFCPQPGQAQRIARRVFNERRSMRGEIITNLAGLTTMGHINGTVEMDILEEGYKPTVKFGSQRFMEDGTKVKIPVVFRPMLSAWSVATDEADAPTALADIQFSGDLDSPTITESRFVKTGASTNAIRIRFSSVSGATGYEATSRTWDGSSSGPRTSMTEDNTNLWATTANGISAGSRYLFEVRAFNSDGDLGNWSDELDYTAAYTSAAPTGLSISVSQEWNGVAGSAFTALVESSCTDINVATGLLEYSFDEVTWYSIGTEEYINPYANFDDTVEMTGPSSGNSQNYYFRLTAKSSTGETSTVQTDFGLSAP